MSATKFLIFHAGNQDSMVFLRDYIDDILPKIKKYGLDVSVMDVRKLSRQQLTGIARFVNAGVFPFAIVSDGREERYYQKKAQIYEIISDECIKVKNASRTGGRGPKPKQGISDVAIDNPEDFLDRQRSMATGSMTTDEEVSMDVADSRSGGDDRKYMLSDGNFGRHSSGLQGRSVGSSAVRQSVATFGSDLDNDGNVDGIASEFINKSAMDYDQSAGDIRELFAQAIIDPGLEGSESKVSADGVGNTVPRMRY